jgi:hypothetical protein
MWSAATPFPQARAEHSVIAFDGKVYAIAGGILKADGKGMQTMAPYACIMIPTTTSGIMVLRFRAHLRTSDLRRSAINYTPSADSRETCIRKHRRMHLCKTQ